MSEEQAPYGGMAQPYVDRRDAARRARKLLSDRPIAFNPRLAHTFGGAITGLFLSQLLYWSDKGRDEEGWIFKTQADFEAETGITRREQDTARKNLKAHGVLHEKRQGLPAQLFYRIDFDAVFAKLDAQISQTWLAETAKLDAQISQPLYRTETTPEITTETTGTEKREEVAIAPSSPKETKETNTIPKWYKILTRDSRWPEKNPIWIEDLESACCRMKGVDLNSARGALEFEALRCVSWLESPNGKAKKMIDRVWTTWIGKVMNDATSNGSMGQSAGRNTSKATSQRGLKPLTPFEEALAEHKARKAAAKASNG